METVTVGGQPVWSLSNTSGTVSEAQLGSTMTTTSNLNSQGFLTELKTMKGSTIIRNLDYQFNGATGNLDWRTGMTGNKESLYYDGSTGWNR